jgi:hypothetical protein
MSFEPPEILRSNPVSTSQEPGGQSVIGMGHFVNGDAGSNLRKQISTGGQSVIGPFRKWDAGSNLRKQFFLGALSYWDSS